MLGNFAFSSKLGGSILCIISVEGYQAVSFGFLCPTGKFFLKSVLKYILGESSVGLRKSR